MELRVFCAVEIQVYYVVKIQVKSAVELQVIYDNNMYLNMLASGEYKNAPKFWTFCPRSIVPEMRCTSKKAADETLNRKVLLNLGVMKTIVGRVIGRDAGEKVDRILPQ